MGLGNVFVLVQVSSFVLVAILSLVVLCPIAVNQTQTKSHCILTVNGNWTTDADTKLRDLSWGSKVGCDYSVFVAVATLVFGIYYTFHYGLYLWKDVDSSWLEAFAMVLASTLMTVLALASSITLGRDFGALCKMLEKNIGESCDIVDDNDFIEDTAIDPTGFYTQFKAAQVGGWMVFIVWLFLAVMAFIKLFRYSREENFLTSMARERERLLQATGRGDRSGFESI